MSISTVTLSSFSENKPEFFEFLTSETYSPEISNPETSTSEIFASLSELNYIYSPPDYESLEVSAISILFYPTTLPTMVTKQHSYSFKQNQHFVYVF